MNVFKISFFKILLIYMLHLVICSYALGQEYTFGRLFDFSSSYLPKPDKVKKFKILAIVETSGEDNYDSIFYDINTGFINYSVSYSKEKVGNDSVFIPVRRINYYCRGGRLDSIVSIVNQNWPFLIKNGDNKIKTLTVYDSLSREKSSYSKIISDSGKTCAFVDSARNFYIKKDCVIICVKQEYRELNSGWPDVYTDTSYYFYNNRNLLVKKCLNGFFFTTYEYQQNRIVEKDYMPRHAPNMTISLYRRGRIIHVRFKNSRINGSNKYYYKNGLISKIINKGFHRYITKFTIIRGKKVKQRMVYSGT